jgi:hypothetical protein
MNFGPLDLGFFILGFLGIGFSPQVLARDKNHGVHPNLNPKLKNSKLHALVSKVKVTSPNPKSIVHLNIKIPSHAP